MPAVTIKGIPEELLDRLRRSAQLNRRSINSEIIFHLERGLRSHPVDPEAVLATARHLRAATAAHPTTDGSFNEAKQDGRP